MRLMQCLASHPFRYYSLGRKALGKKRDYTPALNCLVKGNAIRRTCGNGNGNGGWNQGIMNAALLGNAAIASHQAILRAKTPPGKGYRFQGFAPVSVCRPALPTMLDFAVHLPFC